MLLNNNTRALISASTQTKTLHEAETHRASALFRRRISFSGTRSSVYVLVEVVIHPRSLLIIGHKTTRVLQHVIHSCAATLMLYSQNKKKKKNTEMYWMYTERHGLM